MKLIDNAKEIRKSNDLSKWGQTWAGVHKTGFKS